MPIEVTCRSCGKILVLKESMAGKSGKCPKCGNVIRVPRPMGAAEASDTKMSAHVFGVTVRGGVKVEDVPLRGTTMLGFTRSTALSRARTSPQAMVGVVLAAVGLLAALAPTVPTAFEAPPVLSIAGGMVGALGAALAGWGLMNIRQQPVRSKGKGLALAGLVLGGVALVVGLVVFTGGVKPAGVKVAPGEKVQATAVIADKAGQQKCAEHLKAAYDVLHSFAEAKGGNFPESVADLMPKYMKSTEPMCCPVAAEGTMLYGYNTGLTTESPAETPLLYDTPGNHAGGGNVLLVSGEVVWMTEAELKQRLAVTADQPAATEEPAASE